MRETEEQAQERALARAIAALQDKHVARLPLDGDVAQREALQRKGTRRRRNATRSTPAIEEAGFPRGLPPARARRPATRRTDAVAPSSEVCRSCPWSVPGTSGRCSR